MVYVISQSGKPLMPTTRYRHIRKLLASGYATVVSRKPFTVQLVYKTTEYVQPITLGIDSGYLNIGFSAITETKELISGEVKLLKNMKERIYERKSYRVIRRSRLRYRKCKNLGFRKHDGWLVPSLQHKLDSHVRFIDKLHKILPISKIIVEVANFDIQKIMNPEISGKEYQKGEQLGYSNVHEYVLHRDNHKCQNPNCKHKSSVLQVHHIKYRSNGGTDKPSNMITLCSDCHSSGNHKGWLLAWAPKVNTSYRPETFMSTVRWLLIDRFKVKYKDVDYTYGYITKLQRHELGLEKSHSIDAFVIANGKHQERCLPLEIIQVKRNNRSLETFKDAKVIDIRTGLPVSGSELNCGRTKRNKNTNTENLRKYRGIYIRKGKRSIRKQRYSLQPNDIVKYENKEYEVVGAQSYGTQIKLKDLDKVISMKKVEILKYGKSFKFSDSVSSRR